MGLIVRFSCSSDHASKSRSKIRPGPIAHWPLSRCSQRFSGCRAYGKQRWDLALPGMPVRVLNKWLSFATTAESRRAELVTSEESTGQEPTLELLVRIKDGDDSAWFALDGRFRSALTNLAHGRLKGAMRGRLDTEDLVQVTLAAAHEKLHQYEYRGPGSLQAWLLQILLNRLREGFRYHMSERRDVRLQVDEDCLQSWSDLLAMSPGGALLVAEERSALLDAIAELPDEDSYILLGSLVRELSVADLASELGLAPSSIRRRRARAIGRLRKIIC